MIVNSPPILATLHQWFLRMERSAFFSGCQRYYKVCFCYYYVRCLVAINKEEHMWQNSRSGWGLISILFHWLSALAIIGLFALGWWMTDLGYYDPWYNLGPWVHRSIGILLLMATFARLVWRFVQPTPHAEGSRLETIVAHAGHIALYVLLLTVMVSGYLISTADGRGIAVFGWFEVPAVLYDLPNQASLAGEIHWYSALALMVLAAGHSLAAFKHHWLGRHKTLVRMLNPAHSQSGHRNVPR